MSAKLLTNAYCHIDNLLEPTVPPLEIETTSGRTAVSLRFSCVQNHDPIREYGSTLYVGLARAVSPSNTNFRLTFLLTRLQEALYEDLAV